MDAEPMEILEHRIGEIRPGALRIQVFVAQNESASGVARSNIRGPEGSRVAHMQQSGGRWCDAPPVPAKKFAHGDQCIGP